MPAARVLLGLLSSLILTAGGLGCAGRSQAASEGAAAGTGPVAALREDFDPEPFREDGLIIQPQFGPPAVALPQVSAPAPVPTTEPAAPAPAAAEPVDTGPAAPAPLVTVYRVQVMVLSNEAAARQVAERLQRQLGAPVTARPERGFYMVRAGESTSPAVAEELRQRIVALGREYADAYVLTEEAPAPVAPPVVEVEAAADTALAPAAPALPEVELVRTSGWRVLLHQLQDYREAQTYRQNAIRRLQRNNIDDAVDIVFAAPWYKIEVGNCRTAGEAQRLVERVKSLGYQNALKVRDEVLLPREEN
ncbi:MAG: SPOR domain-containing protein [Gemmatimonadota bacterium]